MTARLLFSLFALPFLGFGLALLGGLVLPVLTDWQAMQGWQATRGELTELTSTGGHRELGYRYSVANVAYTGQRAAVFDGRDNLGRFQRDLDALLALQQRNGGAVQVWYDPQQPARAVLNRDLRPGLLIFLSGIAAVFLVAGGWLARLGWRPTASGGDMVGIGALAEPAWQDGELRGEARQHLLALWCVAAAWNLCAVPVLVWLPGSLAAGNLMLLAALPVPILAVVVLAYVLKRQFDWRSQAQTQVRLDPFPAVGGGHLGGVVELPLPWRRDLAMDVEVECVERSGRVTANPGTAPRWRDRAAAVVAPLLRAGSHADDHLGADGHPGTLVRFRLDLPADLPQSAPAHRDGHEWRLRLVADDQTGTVPGVDLGPWRVPVFPTGRLAAGVLVDPGAAARQAAGRAACDVLDGRLDDALLRRQNLLLESRGAWSRLLIGCGRHAVLATTCLLAGAGQAGAVLHLAADLAALDGFAALWQGIGLVLWLAFALTLLGAAAYLPCNSLDLRVCAGQFRVTRRWLGIPVRQQVLDARSLRALELRPVGGGAQQAGGGRCQLLAHCADGRRVRLLDALGDRALVERLRDHVIARAGLRPAPRPGAAAAVLDVRSGAGAHSGLLDRGAAVLGI